MIVNLRVSKLKRRLQRVVRVYTCKINGNIMPRLTILYQSVIYIPYLGKPMRLWYLSHTHR